MNYTILDQIKLFKRTSPQMSIRNYHRSLTATFTTAFKKRNKIQQSVAPLAWQYCSNSESHILFF